MPYPSPVIQAAKARLSGTVQFVSGDIWRTRLADMPPWKRIFIRMLRVLLLAIRGFREDACMLRASSLTFYTMLSIVPVAAMAFGIAKGFGFQKMLEKQLYENFPGQDEVVGQVVVFAQSMLETTQSGVIAGIGLVLLFWAVVKVLGNIENAFNSIWRVQQPRSIARKFSDYLSIMLISPLLVILQSSATVFITTHVQQIAQEIAVIGYFSPLIALAFKLIPYVIVWVLFTMVYMIMPNTLVKFTSGLLAGVSAGTGYQQQANSPLGGNLGKIFRFLLQRISGFQFPEDGTDVHDHLYLDPQQALSGGPYAYYLRHKSKKLLVKIPPGIRDGQQIRLAAMGQDGKGGGKPGNLLLKVHIRKPLLKSVKDLFSKWKINS